MTVPRRRLSTADMASALMGVLVALTVVTFMGALLNSVVLAGIDVFEASRLERLAGSTVATAIVVVFVAFFCGGWAHGALRGRHSGRREIG